MSHAKCSFFALVDTNILLFKTFFEKYSLSMKGKDVMRRIFSVMCVLFVFILSACNLGVTQPVDESAVTEVPDVDVAAEPETQTDPTATPVQHTMMPGELPETQSGLAGDQDSSVTAPENRAPSGDRFTFGRYERPFNANEMDVYFPNLDIVLSKVYADSDWVYGTISVKDDGSGCDLSGRYGYELDLNVDGGGDILVFVTNPASTDWSTTGVQVWDDANDDVGGSLKTITDETPVESDGYETQLFNDGAGDDADLAWARVTPDDPCTVQLAVKNSVLNGSSAYLIGMWAGNELFDPAKFDHNDAFTQDQAGSSLKEFEYYYPLKEVYELDNTCRMAVGFQPSGGEPGVCPVPPGPPGESAPENPPPGQSCPPPSILYCSPNGCYCLYPQG